MLDKLPYISLLAIKDVIDDELYRRGVVTLFNTTILRLKFTGIIKNDKSKK